MIAFDAAKDQANIAKHGVSLSRAADFVMEMARVSQDDRADYGEERLIAVGPLDNRLYPVIRCSIIRSGYVVIIENLQKTTKGLGNVNID